jgi:isopenicillin N synthase-like dioxygenase
MRLLHYPPQSGVVDDRVLGIGAHTEYVPACAARITPVTGSAATRFARARRLRPPPMSKRAGWAAQCFTILYQHDVPALQVMNTQGRWIDAVPIPGTLVIK